MPSASVKTTILLFGIAPATVLLIFNVVESIPVASEFPTILGALPPSIVGYASGIYAVFGDRDSVVKHRSILSFGILLGLACATIFMLFSGSINAFLPILAVGPVIAGAYILADNWHPYA